MRHLLTTLTLAFATLAIHAQSPRLGINMSLNLPTGEFAERTFQPTLEIASKQTEGYDSSVGATINMSFPIRRSFAFRTGLTYSTTKGTNTATGYETIYLRQKRYSLTGELQIFLQESAMHVGTYFIIGLSQTLSDLNAPLTTLTTTIMMSLTLSAKTASAA